MAAQSAGARDEESYHSAQPIFIIEDIRTAPGQRRALLDLIERDYAPEAARRGHVLKEAWCFPPMELPQAETDLVLLWEIANTRALFLAARDTPDNRFISEFWRRVDGLIVRRTRRVGRSAPYTFTGRAQAPVGRPAPGEAVERHLLLLRPDNAAAAARALEAPEASGPAVAASRLRAMHGFSHNPDHLAWDLDLRPQGQGGPAAVAALQPEGMEAAYHLVLGEVLDAGVREPGLSGGLKRVLLYRADRVSSAEHLRAFEESLIGFPHHIEQIRNWRISRVAQVLAGEGWTHVFEHEFASLEDFTGPYVANPFHWAVHDRYEQPDAPEYCVTAFWHGLYAIDRSVLA